MEIFSFLYYLLNGKDDMRSVFFLSWSPTTFIQSGL